MCPVHIPTIPSVLPTTPIKAYDIDGNPIEEAGNFARQDDGDIILQGASDVEVGAFGNNATMRDLSLMSILQVLKEQLMKVGQRYKDWIDWSHDVDVDPLMLNVPMMIGSVSANVLVSDVMQQASTTVNEMDLYSGNYSGNASLYEEGQTIEFHCRDYGVLMGILSMMPNTGYGQGIHRTWRYKSPLDYPMDIFSTVGDQEVLAEEVFFNNVVSELSKNERTFAYIPRFAEAMTGVNSYGTNLTWGQGLSYHLGKWYDPDTTRRTVYDELIALSAQFLNGADEYGGGGVEGGVRMGDVFRTNNFPDGSTSQMPVIGYIYHEIEALRPLPTYSTPGLV